MPFRSRAFLLSAASIAYVGVAGALVANTPVPWLFAALTVLGLAWVWRRTAAGVSAGRKFAGSITRATTVGLALFTTARIGPDGSAALDAAANFGVGVVAVTSLVALARLEGPGGLLAPPRAARSLDAALLAGFLWAIATALPLTYALLPSYRVRLDPIAIDYATTSAAAASLLLGVAATYRLRAMRRFEMGVGDRAAGALSLSLTAFAVSVPSAALDVAAPDRVLPVAVAAGAALTTWASTIAEPTTVSSALRGILAMMILGTPITLSAGVFARAYPAHAGTIVLGSSILAVLAGVLVRAVARPLGPQQSRWLEAIDAATRAALEPEPDSALTATLFALGRASNVAGARPEIWRIHPGEILRVDVAGYLHVSPGEPPPRLFDLALAEPERTLRAEVLKQAEVRRPDVRGLLAWFEARDAFSATVVMDDDGPVGFILLPRAGRNALLTLEEARAVRGLADRISSLLTVTSALSRTRERETRAQERLGTLEADRDRLERALESRAGRHRAVAERLAQKARGAAYASASRAALEALERAGRTAGGIGLVTPAGVDPAGWAAHAHLASERAGGPFVSADCTLSSEQDLERWNDPDKSPLRLADGGTLLLCDVDALPLALQEHVATMLGARRAATSTLPGTGLVVSSHASLETLAELGRIAPELWRAIDTEVKLPALVDRAEDLRALVLSGLARESARVGREPLGVDAAALRLLVEHTWPGNELELEAVLLRAVRVAGGKTVSAENLAAIGFEVKGVSNRAHEPFTPGPPPSVRRRAPRRWTRRSS
ncbi:MAG TPA: hypothetical protein VFZ53_03535 [Polyangiaceae bacterium]